MISAARRFVTGSIGINRRRGLSAQYSLLSVILVPDGSTVTPVLFSGHPESLYWKHLERQRWPKVSESPCLMARETTRLGSISITVEILQSQAQVVRFISVRKTARVVHSGIIRHQMAVAPVD